MFLFREPIATMDTIQQDLPIPSQVFMGLTWTGWEISPPSSWSRHSWSVWSRRSDDYFTLLSVVVVVFSKSSLPRETLWSFVLVDRLFPWRLLLSSSMSIGIIQIGQVRLISGPVSCLLASQPDNTLFSLKGRERDRLSDPRVCYCWCLDEVVLLLLARSVCYLYLGLCVYRTLQGLADIDRWVEIERLKHETFFSVLF